jgi:hypothetical protein
MPGVTSALSFLVEPVVVFMGRAAIYLRLCSLGSLTSMAWFRRKAEQRQARLKTDDLDGHVIDDFPLLPFQTEVSNPSRDAARFDNRLAAGHVAELLGDAGRRIVPLNGRRLSSHSPETQEREFKHRRAHLGAETPALKALPEPRRSRDCPLSEETLPVHGLAANERAAGPDAEVQAPLLVTPTDPQPTVILDPIRHKRRRAKLVRPRDDERHLISRMNTLLGHLRELDKLSLSRQP